MKRLQKILKRRKQLSLDGTNQQASVIEGFERENQSDHTDSNPTKVSQNRNLGAIQREENQKVGKRGN